MDFNNLFDDKIDVYILQNEENRLYFCGVSTSFGAVILHKDRQVFITDFRYEFAVRAKLPDWELYFIKYSQYYDTISMIAESVGAKTVGFEDDSLSYGDYKLLKEALKDCTLKPCSQKINELRAVKTEKELSYIAKAQSIAEEALEETIKKIRPKISERDIVAELIYNIYKFGGDGVSFKPIVAMGINGAEPHHTFTDYKLEKDDLITIDMGVKYKGYCSDMTRTFTLGEPDPKLVEIYNIVLKAQEYALTNIKEGITAHEADSYAREYITANGYGKEFGHGLGHGVGLGIHEYPRVGNGSNIVLKENMVITVEPGIYVSGLGGVRIEDMVVVKKDGIQNLTQFSKNMKL